jgi:hypothetical protein
VYSGFPARGAETRIFDQLYCLGNYIFGYKGVVQGEPRQCHDVPVFGANSVKTFDEICINIVRLNELVKVVCR